MNVHISKKKAHGSAGLPVIKCSCCVEILLVPDVKLMSKAIEAHVEEHRQKVKDPKEAEEEAERVRNDLTEKVLKKAGKT